MPPTILPSITMGTPAFHQIDLRHGEIAQSRAAARDNILQFLRRPTKFDRGAGLTFGDANRGKLRTVETLQHYRVAAAVDNRDNDIQVVLLRLRFGRGHRLFCLIKCDRSAIVTNTFMNGGLRRSGAFAAGKFHFESASHHSITSSARASTVVGTSRPRALAVFRLTTSSYFVGACTKEGSFLDPCF